jgi:two-component system chemotaxis response regulator CheY
MEQSDATTILVADDSPTIRRLLGGLLKLRHYEIVEATDGEEALTRLGERPCRLAILDVQMPRMDGFQVVRSIRQIPGLADLAVLVLTTDPSAGEIALEAGANGFMLKPFQPQELLQVVARLLAGERQ